MRKQLIVGVASTAIALTGACSQETDAPAGEVEEVVNSPEEAATAEASMAVCDENGARYASEDEALAAGLEYAQFGATMCPEYKMDPSWDANGDGVNDCEDEGTCSAEIDYMAPRPAD